jgi:hypothetical protein
LKIKEFPILDFKKRIQNKITKNKISVQGSWKNSKDRARFLKRTGGSR